MCVVSDKLVTFARQNFEPFCSLRTWLAAKRRFGEMKRRFRKIKRRIVRAKRRFIFVKRRFISMSFDSELSI